MPKNRFLLLGLLFFIALPFSMAQAKTGASGVVVDAQTGETLPSVQVYFVGTTIGTITDLDGNFSIENTQGLVTLSFQMVGYKTQILSLKANKILTNQRIELQTDVYGLQEIVVKPQRLKREERYRRKGNPAVELVRKVIEHKNANRIESVECYTSKSYEKLIMALDRFDVDFDSSLFWHEFQFLEKYIDTSQFNTTPTLTVSLRETMARNDYQSHPMQERKYVIANRFQGIDAILDREGLATNIDAMFTKVNIFDNDIEIMLNRFVSPLSSTLAVSFYHYYIMDTLDVDGDRCIDLAFAPVNPESYGFTGHLYIMNDSTYALKKYSINVPPYINMNFVSDLAIEQSFKQLDNGLWVSDKTNTFVRFYLFKNMRQIYARHNLYQYDYEIGAMLPDSLMVNMNGNESVADSARKYVRSQWNAMRPLELTGKESVIDSLMPELRRIPKFDAAIRVGEVAVSGYLATNRDRQKSKFDFGPLYNTLSYNGLEGVRLRVGGMTTTNLHPHWFMNGYLAFGFNDLRLKHNATLIYSFNDKMYHPYESLRHALYLSTYYDVEVPGQTYSLFDRDNVFMSFSMGTPTQRMQYVRRTKLRYEKEWANRFSVDAWLQHENNEAAGTLHYARFNDDGSLSNIKYYNDLQLGLTLRFAPGEPLYNNRLGQESPFNLSKDTPVISLTHTMGYMDGQFFYNRTDINAEKRFWLSAFGHIDVTVQTGIIWSQVPYPKLYIPNSNQSLFLTPKSFSLMQPMEFVMDQYVAFFGTYYLKGWIFNRIPLVKKLKLREVASFNAVYGGLSQKNNPTLMHEGLYVLPEGCSPMGKVPYMEMSLGVENILKFIRVDWVHRLTYTDGLSNKEKNGVRLTFRLTF
ncbi:MAG: carboxypeptidase-like regulatory domain-containing protein [Bacteroidales bacterium]|nr:carboxypeptidase-like regulatory domain-containing protein [Bacteroidales bacterium]